MSLNKIIMGAVKFLSILTMVVLAGVATILWQFRFVLFVLLPISYEVIKWPALLNRDSDAIFVLFLPCIYVWKFIKKVCKCRKNSKGSYTIKSTECSEYDYYGVPPWFTPTLWALAGVLFLLCWTLTRELNSGIIGAVSVLGVWFFVWVGTRL